MKGTEFINLTKTMNDSWLEITNYVNKIRYPTDGEAIIFLEAKKSVDLNTRVVCSAKKPGSYESVRPYNLSQIEAITLKLVKKAVKKWKSGKLDTLPTIEEIQRAARKLAGTTVWEAK